MIVVNWAPALLSITIEGMDHAMPLEIVTIPPDPFYKHIASVRDKSEYLKCPAFIETVKNSYIIRSPFDMVLSYDRAKKWLHVENILQHDYDNHFVNRGNKIGDNDPAMATGLPRYVFYSESPVHMQMGPLPLLEGPKNAAVVPGGFNISKWVRPIDWTFEFIDDAQPISVKREDPLFLITFFTPNGEKVQLNRVPFTPELFYAYKACAGVKRFVPKLSLNKCYEIAEGFLQTWRNSK